MDRQSKVLDGVTFPELDNIVQLAIRTYVPSKWRFVDLETGQVYRVEHFPDDSGNAWYPDTDIDIAATGTVQYLLDRVKQLKKERDEQLEAQYDKGREVGFDAGVEYGEMLWGAQP